MEAKHSWSYKYFRVLLIVESFKLVFGSLVFVASFFITPKYPPGISKEAIEVESREKGRKIKVDIYRPSSSKEDGNALLPVHLHFHGSGYVLPVHGSDGEFCANLSDRLKMIVLDCDYRKFPSPFPAAYHDCLDLVKWCSSQTDRGWDVNKISIGGRSAGGNLALATSSTLPNVIKSVTALYPPTDFRKPEFNVRVQQPSISNNYDSGVPLTFWMVGVCDDAYLLDRTDREDSKLSVILAEAKSFPKHICVVTGECDILYSEGKQFISNLQEDGHKNAVFMSIENEGHAFDGVCKKGSVSEKRKELAYDAICRTIEAGWKE